MHDCTLTAQDGAADLTVLVVGHARAKAPAEIEREAARIAAGTAKAPQSLLVGGRRFLLLKPADDAWLAGGEAWRLLGRDAVAEARRLGLTSVRILVGGVQADPQAVGEGALLGDYCFDLLRSGEAAQRKRLTVRLPGHATAVKAAIGEASAQNLARELCDLPGNLLNPVTFATRARRELRGTGVQVKVVQGLAALRRARLPGMCQVGQAGSTPPALVELRWRPARAKAKVRLALVGKGLTFDSGGISLKPGSEMWEMKADMTGAADVLAAMKRIAEVKLPLAVDGYLVLCENLPDSRAQRPGDIYRARNGVTVHVDNTDAEGRLAISDVLTLACERGATHLVDVATLTGSCMVALGMGIAGVMGRDEAWVREVREAGLERGEELWPLPLYGEYRKQIEHPHADLNNIGGKWGGAITAGLFLDRFVPAEVKWAHCDIAGPAIRTDGWRCYARGMTAFGTRTLIRLAQRLAGRA